MNNVHGKEIPLQYVTVKVPGQKPRGSRTVNSAPITESTGQASHLKLPLNNIHRTKPKKLLSSLYFSKIDVYVSFSFPACFPVCDFHRSSKR